MDSYGEELGLTETLCPYFLPQFLRSQLWLIHTGEVHIIIKQLHSHLSLVT